MKRLVRFTILLIILFVILAAPATAAGQVYYQFQATTGSAHSKVTIAMPPEYMVFTRDSSPDDPNFAVLGADAAALKDYLQQNDIFIEAVATDFEAEFFIKMNSTTDSITVGNYNRFSDKELNGFEHDIRQGLKERGFDVSGYQVVDYGSQKYLNVSASLPDNGSVAYFDIYMTVVNKYQVGFYFKNYVQEVTASQKETLRQIVETAAYYPEDYYSPVKATSFAGSFLRNFFKYALIGGVLAAGGAIRAAIKRKKAAAQTSSAAYMAPAATVSTQNSYSACEENPVNIILCPACGMKNQNDRRVCYRCGRPLNPESPTDATAADESEPI